MASLQICPYFKHLLLEIRKDHSETVHFSSIIEKEVLIVVNLLKMMQKKCPPQFEMQF